MNEVLCFTVNETFTLSPEAFNAVRSLKKPLYLISFGSGDINDPSTDPIMVVFKDGEREYHWRRGVYRETSLSSRSLQSLSADANALSADDRLKLSSLIYRYLKVLVPTPIGKNAALYKQEYCRVLYLFKHGIK